MSHSEAKFKSKPEAKSVPKSSPSAHDAIELLTADHEKVRKMFKEFEKFKKGRDDGDEKAALVDKICMALTVHAPIEEEQRKMFPKVKKTKIDTKYLGAQIFQRKQVLQKTGGPPAQRKKASVNHSPL